MLPATGAIGVNEMFRVGDIVLTDKNKYYAYKIIREVSPEYVEVKAVIGFERWRNHLVAELQKVPRDIFHKKISAKMK